ncbi:MAG TPA: DUF6526 family protein [Chitinophagaceae bacterium]|nr:DUF6526 family protein [Chitinophagaceae bacterium]
MKKQDYGNHAKYYTSHHFIFYPVVLVLLIICLWQAITNEGRKYEWLAISALVALVGWLSFMVRQHYSITLQNRLVRMELRFRYFVLTSQRLEPLEAQLTFAQLAALRFASDEELPGLITRALQDGLSPKEIKKSIREWVGDFMRV